MMQGPPNILAWESCLALVGTTLHKKQVALAPNWPEWSLPLDSSRPHCHTSLKVREVLELEVPIDDKLVAENRV